MGCYTWYSEEETGRAASVPITVLLYNGPLLSDFTVPVKGLVRLSSAEEDSDCADVTRCRQEAQLLLGQPTVRCYF